MDSVLFAGACGDPPTAPPRELQPTVPEPSPAPTEPVETTFTVTNGWTGQPVAGARVSAADTQMVTDSAGQVRLLKTWPCVTMEVVATGFLERRTCATSEITLWPVADAAEQEATRSAVFSAGLLFGGSGFLEVMLSPELRLREDVVQTWTAAAEEIRELTLGRYLFAIVDQMEWGYIIGEASSHTVCGTGLQWPPETSGFCTEPTPDYAIGKVHVAAGRLTDRSVALRVLLATNFVLRPHPAAGLLNSARPDQNLSAFERKTLHMIGLRKNRLAWPDFDQVP